MHYPACMGPGCTICAHPDRATIDAKLASGVPILSIARDHSLTAARSSLYRHASSGHALAAKPKGETAPQATSGHQEQLSETILKATRLAKSAERHMRKALKSDDLKAANGALASATKAFELFGKATGQLQTGGNVNVNVSAEARNAIDLRESVSNLTHTEVSALAQQWLTAQLEAGDRDAMRIVLSLVRLIPGADASTEPQRLTGEPSPSTDPIIGG